MKRLNKAVHQGQSISNQLKIPLAEPEACGSAQHPCTHDHHGLKIHDPLVQGI